MGPSTRIINWFIKYFMYVITVWIKIKMLNFDKVYYYKPMLILVLWSKNLEIWQRSKLLIKIMKQWSQDDHMRSSHMGTKKVNKLWKRHGNRFWGIKWPCEPWQPHLRFVEIKSIKPYNLFSFKVRMCNSNHISVSIIIYK